MTINEKYNKIIVGSCTGVKYRDCMSATLMSSAPSIIFPKKNKVESSCIRGYVKYNLSPDKKEDWDLIDRIYSYIYDEKPKIGDEVLILNVNKIYTENYIPISNEMVGNIGKNGIVTGFYNFNNFEYPVVRCDSDYSGGFFYSPNWLFITKRKDVIEAENGERKFSCMDGDIVTWSSGAKSIVVGEWMFDIGDKGEIERTISSFEFQGMDLDSGNVKTIERYNENGKLEEIFRYRKKMKIEEIERELGYCIEIIDSESNLG